MEQKNQNNQNKFLGWIKSSLTIKMIIVGILTLILLIPLSYINDLIDERQDRQQSVVEDINQKWGEEVLLYGPVLEIPYITYIEVIKKNAETKAIYTEKVARTNYGYFFPKQLNVDAQLDPEIKAYGMYNSVVYSGLVHLNGMFSKPDIKAISSSDPVVLWNKARVIFKTSDLKGVSNQVSIKVDSQSYSFSPKYSTDKKSKYVNQKNPVSLNSLESQFLNDSTVKNQFTFSMDISYNGSQQFRIIPIGKETQMTVTSSWKNPSFTGTYLPYNNDKLTENGFGAKWKILNINRPFPQAFSDKLPNLSEYAFGVNLMIPVDQYQQSTRSAKYGYLVISLTFLIFFLIQSISKIDIHPFQYLMIGLALVMFYTLLLSISEHSSFLIAYFIASISVVILIGLYSKSILKGWKFPIFITISLVVLYSFIYIIIQLESYALLVGSIGLFLILAAVMFVSRKIDWNSRQYE